MTEAERCIDSQNNILNDSLEKSPACSEMENVIDKELLSSNARLSIINKIEESENIPDSSNSFQTSHNSDTETVENQKTFAGLADLSSRETKVKANEDEWLDIMGSGNFKKKVIKAGLGHDTRPERGDAVTVSVSFYVNSTLFEENQNLKFIVGDLDVIQGLDLVVCLMEKEETAKVMIPSKLAYGKSGRLPEVPPDTDIECDVELKQVESFDCDSMSVLERLQLGNEKRMRGNYYYERGEYIEAIHCYEKAAECLDGIRDCSGTSTEESQSVVDMRIKVYNNIAVSHLKLSAYSAALKSVELVLKVQPKNVKALFRKGKILRELGSTDEAIVSLKAAANLEPETKVIQSELNKLINIRKREEQSQKAMYQRMFPQSIPKKTSLHSKVLKWSAVTGGVLAVAAGMVAYRQYHS